MHDPSVLAFSIKSPIKKSCGLDFKYRETWISIWHEDPCTDNSDDSCGWFKRARHGDKKVLQAIEHEFAFCWDGKSGFHWFYDNGDPQQTLHGIVLQMFHMACFCHYKKNHRKMMRFMNRHLYDILFFADNATDSMNNLINNKYGEKRKDRIEQAASIVYGCILRWDRPWWKHPRWHIHHWRIRFDFLNKLKPPKPLT